MTLSGLYNEIDDQTKSEIEPTYSNSISQNMETSKVLQDPRRAAIKVRNETNFQSNSNMDYNQFRFASELPHQGMQTFYTSSQTNTGNFNFTSLPYQPVDVSNNTEFNREMYTNQFDTSYRPHHYRGRNNRGKYDNRNFCNPNSKYQNYYGKPYHRPYNRRGRGYGKYHDFSNRNEFSFSEYGRDQSYEPYQEFRYNYKDNYQQMNSNYGFQNRDYSMAFSQIPNNIVVTDNNLYNNAEISDANTFRKTLESSNQQTVHKSAPESGILENLKKCKETKKKELNSSKDEETVSLSYIPSSNKMDIIKRIYNSDIVPLPKDSLAKNLNKDYDSKTKVKNDVIQKNTRKTKSDTSKVPLKSKNTPRQKKDRKTSSDKELEDLRKLSNLDPLLSPLPSTPNPETQQITSSRAPTKLMNFKRLLEKNEKDISASDVEFIKQSSTCTVSNFLTCSNNNLSDMGNDSERIGRPRKKKETVNSKTKNYSVREKSVDLVNSDSAITTTCNPNSVNTIVADSTSHDSVNQRARSDSSSTEEGQYKSPKNDPFSSPEQNKTHSKTNHTYIENEIPEQNNQNALIDVNTEHRLFDSLIKADFSNISTKNTNIPNAETQPHSPKSNRSSSSDSTSTSASDSSSSSSSESSSKSTSSTCSKNSASINASPPSIKIPCTDSTNFSENVLLTDHPKKVDMSEFEFRCGKDFNLYKDVESRLQLKQSNDQLYNPRFRPHLKKKRPPSSDSDSDTYSLSRSRSSSCSSSKTHKLKRCHSRSCSESSTISGHRLQRSKSRSTVSRSRSRSTSKSSKKSVLKSDTKNQHKILTYGSPSDSENSICTENGNDNQKHKIVRSRSRSSDSDILDRSLIYPKHSISSNRSWSSESVKKSKRVDIDFTCNDKNESRSFGLQKRKYKRKSTKKISSDDSDSSMQLFCKKRISGTLKSDSELSDNDLPHREYIKLQEQKQSAKYNVQRGRVPTKDFEKLFRKTFRAFEYKQIPKKPFPENKLKESVYSLCSNGCSKSGALIIYFTRSKAVAEDIKAMQKDLMIRPNITMSEPFKMNHAPPRYYDKESIKNFIELLKQGPYETWNNIDNSAHTLYTRHSDLKTIIIYAATPIDLFIASKICNNYAKKRPKEIVLRFCNITDGDHPISIYNPVSRDFLSKYMTLCKY
ncbi:regulatory protein IE2 [macacine betaherpesvirus 9]|uniref:Regulatory protein IE2 n=1 Tax=macacine betaherpesvirus 9 TaxID=2560568 RepID=A0A192XNJ2_9BETA|nr:regulatory protein IE2 [macacine betaherpesvirus 9]ANC96517.1 regulatory protein IE2 [macacine betaherpesvirus 9]